MIKLCVSIVQNSPNLKSLEFRSLPTNLISSFDACCIPGLERLFTKENERVNRVHPAKLCTFIETRFNMTNVSKLGFSTSVTIDETLTMLRAQYLSSHAPATLAVLSLNVRIDDLNVLTRFLDTFSGLRSFWLNYLSPEDKPFDFRALSKHANSLVRLCISRDSNSTNSEHSPILDDLAVIGPSHFKRLQTLVLSGVHETGYPSTRFPCE